MKSAANYDPRLWGKCGWKFLHYIALGYSNKPTEENKLHYKNFMMNLSNVIPCIECRENFIKHSKKNPIDDYLDNSQKLFQWVVKIQNEVSKTLKRKPMRIIKSDNLKKFYVNEQRRIDLKNCCGLQAKSEKILKNIF